MKKTPIVLKASERKRVVLRGESPRAELKRKEKELRKELEEAQASVMFFHSLSTQSSTTRNPVKLANRPTHALPKRAFTLAAIEVGNSLHIGYAVCGDNEAFDKLFGRTQALIRLNETNVVQRVPLPESILKIKTPVIRSRRKGELLTRFAKSFPKKYPHLFDKQLGIEYAMQQAKQEHAKSNSKSNASTGTGRRASAKHAVVSRNTSPVKASKKSSPKKPMKKGGKC